MTNKISLEIDCDASTVTVSANISHMIFADPSKPELIAQILAMQSKEFMGMSRNQLMDKFLDVMRDGGAKFHTSPQTRKSLSDDEIINIGKQSASVEGSYFLPIDFARAIEKAHGIGVE